MNILIVNYYNFYDGGASMSSYYLASALKKLGNNVYIASTGNYPDVETFVFKEFRLMPIFQVRDLYLTHFLSKIIREKKIDIIHSSDGRFSPIAVINVAKKYNIPSVVHFRDYWFCCLKGDLLFKNKRICQGLNLKRCLKCRRKLRWPWEIYKYLYFRNRINKLNQADAKIAISGTMKNQLMKFKITRHVEVVNNSVNVQYYNILDVNKIKDIKEKYKLNRTVITFIGKLIYHKGIDIFLNLITELNYRRKNIFFLVIGDGELKDFSHQFVKKNKIKNILFLNFVKLQEMPYIYSISDIIVYPLVMSGFGRIVIEAMVAGKPIIASNVEGMDEAVVDYETGFLVNIFDKEELVNKTLKLIDDKNLRMKMGECAKKHSARFSDLRVAQKIYNIYQELHQGYGKK